MSIMAGLTRRIGVRDRYNLELISEAENLLNRLTASCSIDGCTGAVVKRDGAARFSAHYVRAKRPPDPVWRPV